MHTSAPSHSAEIQAGRSSARLIVAVDTSGDMLVCAVGRPVRTPGKATGIEVLGSADRMCRRHANEELILSVDALIADLGYGRQDVAAVLCGRGPGSFTGVRIGVASAKGLACGLDVPLYSASVLDAVAWNLYAAGIRSYVCVVADAMRKEVYPGLYSISEDGPQRLFSCEYVMRAPQACAALAARSDRDGIMLAGDGLVKYRDLFEQAGFERFCPEELWYPSGRGLLLACAASGDLDDASAGDPADVLPIYTRLSDAEENERIRLGIPETHTLLTSGVDDALADRHMQLRPMGVNDCAAVAELEARAFEHTSKKNMWNAQMFADEVVQTGHIWWLAHDQGRPVAFAGGSCYDGNLEVLDVAVDACVRRRGLGRRLLERVAYDAQMLGASTATLEVASDNTAAQNLYGCMGFEVVGRRPDYYAKGADALIMQAHLPLTACANPAALGGEALSHDVFKVPSSVPRSGSRSVHTDCERQILKQAGDLILAVETSCDETAMAVIDGHGEIRANVVATQIDFHARFGGVVPEIASRKHIEALVDTYRETMAQAAASLGVEVLGPSDLACVSVTQGPGLVGALVVGIAFVKGLAWANDLPLVCVNHLEGHLFANLFETPDLAPPFVASLLSGGHTMLVHVRDWGDYRVLGQTLDDAVGEAFDKVAKALGLGYPGGPVISRLAKTGNPRAIDFPRAMMHSHDYRFSLSGLKTAVITYINTESAAGRVINLNDLAASFEAAVIDVQVSKAVHAVKECKVKDFCAGGGVSANPELREAYRRAFERRGVRVTLPPLSACTDNAAMIALVAKRSFEAGQISDLSADALPNMRLDDSSRV